jgi:hypothetical protein
MNVQALKIKLVTVLSSAVFLLLGATPGAVASSPVGQWDLVITGHGVSGNAFIEFFGDGTLLGYEIISIPPQAEPDARGVQTGRNDPQPTNSASSTNVFGDAGLRGTWALNSKGQVIGFFNEEYTLITATTNVPVTNGVSFLGTAKSSRLTLRCDAQRGRSVYRGAPSSDVAGVPGDYIATFKQNNVNSVYFISVAPAGGTPNSFDVVGMGPGGVAIAGSAQFSPDGHMSLVTGIVGPGSTITSLTAMSGSANYKKGTWKLKGTDSTGLKVSGRVERADAEDDE